MNASHYGLPRICKEKDWAKVIQQLSRLFNVWCQAVVLKCMPHALKLMLWGLHLTSQELIRLLLSREELWVAQTCNRTYPDVCTPLQAHGMYQEAFAPWICLYTCFHYSPTSPVLLSCCECLAYTHMMLVPDLFLILALQDCASSWWAHCLDPHPHPTCTHWPSLPLITS